MRGLHDAAAVPGAGQRPQRLECRVRCRGGVGGATQVAQAAEAWEGGEGEEAEMATGRSRVGEMGSVAEAETLCLCSWPPEREQR